ncbi:alpha/beta fold hydrolase [Amycolatopsis jiangsuensis]|uniref:Pimeloyl-ACP methyl ester carboxylesterase n=1 Tax=Amycolatopsis jiangsuensis TaxID=1181879 RepID=A0A840IZU6_9PSEU|nr:alpha/beta hydrolase [Amycolatopsis jiangsuensis]MBB4686925.1 pimeloyl-ACP methyl ester carboxylesterase [Amycolatopsis jiangsuensis]
MGLDRLGVEGRTGRLSVLRTSGHRPGVPLVLIHPINSAAVVWTDVAARLDRPVVALDLRGHGDSGLTGPFTVEEGYVPDVLAVLDSLGVNEVHLAGGSLGGTICVALAALYPRRVLSVTTFGSTLGTGVPAEAIGAMVSELEAGGTAAYFAGLVPDIVGREHRESAHLKEVMAEAVGTRPEAVVAEILYGAFGADIRHLAGKVATSTIPVLAVAGDEDPTCPPSMSRELAETTGGIAKVLDGTGHLPMLEEPGQVADLLRTHIARAEGEAS